MSATIPPSPLSPSVGARRKGAKTLPRLPLSAFTPPNSGASDKFPLPPSPSTLQPEQIIDAYIVTSDGDLCQWKEESSRTFGGKTKGAVLSLRGNKTSEVETVVQGIRTGSSEVPVLAILAPILDDDSEGDFTPPSYLFSGSSLRPHIAASIKFTKNDKRTRDALLWALQEGLTVNLDVKCDLRECEGGWEVLEEMLERVTKPQENTHELKAIKAKIVLSNILPPPDDLSLPIVKLLTHSSYRDYQFHTAALSLFSNIYINFIPPSWGAQIPSLSEESEKERNEWKRRIKMYIGPALEAFGFQRIIFGSSPSLASNAVSNAADWCELTRESFAELGVEQECIDAVFFGNANLLYGSS
ncbi:hypothetical protein AcW1_003647 [Taiwanofungus camphoratus]|nr:hypothetical protein AcW1_003647 [Antrodia cinnamomea]